MLAHRLRRWPNINQALVQRRWPNINQALVQRLVFAGRAGVQRQPSVTAYFTSHQLLSLCL